MRRRKNLLCNPRITDPLCKNEIDLKFWPKNRQQKIFLESVTKVIFGYIWNLCSAEAVRGENCGDRREAGPEEERGARVVLQPAAEAEAHEVCCAALTARRRRRVGCCGGGQWPLQPPPPPGPLPTDVGRDGGGRRRGRLRAASAKLKHLLWHGLRRERTHTSAARTRADTLSCGRECAVLHCHQAQVAISKKKYLRQSNRGTTEESADIFNS